MKKITTIILLLATNLILAQRQAEYIAIATPNRDTLFIDNTSAGDAILFIWNTNNYRDRPVIVRVPELTNDLISRCLFTRRESN